MPYKIKNLFFSGFRHYLKAHFWVMLGVAVSTAIITGALIVGDSVRYSLEQTVSTRLGSISHALVSGERFFTKKLSDKLNEKGIPTSAALQLEGIASTDGGQLRLNNIQVWGIDENFYQITSPDQSFLEGTLSAQSALISENTSRRLNLSVGDPFLLRIQKGSLLPANAPFVSAENQSVSARLTVGGILSTEQMGRLNLQNSQTAPFNIFIPIDLMNRLSEMEARANVLFVNTPKNEDDIKEAIYDAWTLEDAGLTVIEAAADDKWELRSGRVFMDDAIEKLVANTGISFTPILTYFANEFSFNGHVTPYSFVSTLPDEGMQANDIVINQWLADDLGAQTGDSISLKYYEVGPLRELNEVERKFRIVSVEAIDGYFGDRLLMPEIPGLSDSESCRDWDTGVPINLKTIRNKDEDYWYQFRGTPKAFVAHSTGLQLWGNRFGSATAYRFPFDETSKENLIKALEEQIDPFALDLQLRKVRKEGFRAAAEGTDFSSLFLGLSFFILVSGLLITALLFVFNLEKRKTEMGTLSALGLNNKSIFRLFFYEGLIIAILGAILGTGLAIIYNKLIFIGLNSLWHDIVRTDVLISRYSFPTMLLGFLLSVLISLATMLVALRRTLRLTIVQMQRKQTGLTPKWLIILQKYAACLFLGLGIALLIVQTFTSQEVNATLFFISGASLLVAAILFANLFLLKKPTHAHQKKITPKAIVMQNLRYSRSRSLMVLVLLAIGTYLVVSTGMNRKDFYGKSDNQKSGTGGFLYWAESTMPVLHNLNDESYRQSQAFEENFSVVQFHTAEGDDASCLNLNRISNPRVLGVDSKSLNGRFTFQTKMDGLNNTENLWPLLKNDFGTCIPAIADQTVIQWSLGKKVGDTLVYQNSLGEQVKLLLIGGLSASVFQGNVIIDNSMFLKHFPTVSGTNIFLIDGNHENPAPIAEELNLAYRDLGWEMQLTAERLAMFNSIERTYLTIFLVLGALGLLIGTIGLAIVIQRTLLERKQEFSILTALGFSRTKIQNLVVAEFSILLIAGMLIGFATAIISVLPLLSAQFNNLSVGFVGLLMVIIVANGMVWIVLPTRRQLHKQNLIENLRND
jgi:ABC-type lipoprotein release transport system permease subunit